MGNVITTGSGLVNDTPTAEITLTPKSLVDASTFKDQVILATGSEGVMTVAQNWKAGNGDLRSSWKTEDYSQLYLDNWNHFPRVFLDNQGNKWVSEFDLKARSIKHFGYSAKAKKIASIILGAINNNVSDAAALSKYGVYLITREKTTLTASFTMTVAGRGSETRETKVNVYAVVMAGEATKVGPSREDRSGCVDNQAQFPGWGQSCYAILSSIQDLKPVPGCELGTQTGYESEKGDTGLQAASDAFTNFYDGPQSGWFANVGPPAAAAWDACVRNKYRPSLCDGAWSSTNDSPLSFALDTQDTPASGPYVKIIDYQDSSEGKGLSSPPAQIPWHVEVHGLYFCPLTVFGLIVDFAGDIDHRPVWIDPVSKLLVRRVTLMPDAAFQPMNSDKTCGGLGILGSVQKNGNAADTWRESGAPKMLPNFLYNPVSPSGGGGNTPSGGGGGGNTPSGGGGNTPSGGGGNNTNGGGDKHASWHNLNPPKPTKRWTKAKLRSVWAGDMATFVPADKQKYFQPGADLGPLTSAEQDYVKQHSVDKFIEVVEEASEDYKDRKIPAMFRPKPHLYGESQLNALRDHWNDPTYTYIWWALNQPDSWQVNVPASDTQHKVKVQAWYFLDQLGLDVQDLEYAALAGVAAAFGFRNHVNPLVMFTGTTLASLTAMLAYNNKLTTWLQVESAYFDFYDDVKRAKRKGKKGLKEFEKSEEYILIGVTGLALTTMVMYGTYETLGAASAEVLGSEFMIGLILTGIAELVVWVDFEEKKYAKWL